MKVIKNKKYAGFSIVALIIASTLLYIIPPHMANTSAEEYSGTDSASGEWQWEVNVQETLNMTVDPVSSDHPATAQGNTDEFLRTQVGVEVSTNNGDGYTVGMTTKTADTDLVNTAEGKNTIKLPTMSTTATCADADCKAFPVNVWGYSLNDDGNTGTYDKLVGVNSAPITVLSNATNGSNSKNVYFGAKANSTQEAGTYKGTVVFSVTTETKGKDLPASGAAGDPGTPQGPSAEPSTSPSSQPSVAPAASNTFSYTTGTRTYRSTATSVAETANTEGVSGKRSTASDFVSPLGVNERTYSTMNIQRGSLITTILMCVAFLAAGIGIFFFILAKRRDEEEEEDEIQQV